MNIFYSSDIWFLTIPVFMKSYLSRKRNWSIQAKKKESFFKDIKVLFLCWLALNLRSNFNQNETKQKNATFNDIDNYNCLFLKHFRRRFCCRSSSRCSSLNWRRRVQNGLRFLPGFAAKWEEAAEGTWVEVAMLFFHSTICDIFLHCCYCCV